MRLTRIAVLLWGCVLALGARAEWDHDANLSVAVGDFLQAYDAGGMANAEKIAAGCQASLADIVDDLQSLMRFEYCVGIDFAGFLTNRREMDERGREGTSYFSSEQVQSRLERLNKYHLNPLMHQEIIQAWGRSVAGELDRRTRAK